MSLSKSKCWYSNNCLHFFKCAVPFDSLLCRQVKEPNSLEHLTELHSNSRLIAMAANIRLGWKRMVVSNTGLLSYGNNYDSKKFYITSPAGESAVNNFVRLMG